MCSLRAAGQEPDSVSSGKALQNPDDTDAGSALLRYAGSIAPRSSLLESSFEQVVKLGEPSFQILTPSDSRSIHIGFLDYYGGLIRCTTDQI